MRGISRLRGSVASMPHATRDHTKLRMAFKKIQLPPQPLRRAPIISVQAGDKFATSGRASTLQGGGNSTGRLRQYTNPSIGAGSQCENACGLIVRAIVDRQQLPIFEC